MTPAPTSPMPAHDGETHRPTRAPTAGRRRAGSSRGQVLVIFAGATFVLFGLSALVIDVSWYWAGTQRVQRAAAAAQSQSQACPVPP